MKPKLPLSRASDEITTVAKKKREKDRFITPHSRSILHCHHAFHEQEVSFVVDWT